jgi:L-alanine-DL-glutamate epimerase-like enolase superfamily enzyme
LGRGPTARKAGQAGRRGFRLPVLAAMVADVIEQAVIGHDPYDVEMLFDAVYGRAGYSHYPELTKLGILSAIEMACWDIIGKDCGQPVYRLLGGQMRDRVLHRGQGRRRDGYLLPARGPGLGFNLREDVARNHAPQGSQPTTIRSY